MPRQARLDAPGTLHHVMIRGIERKSIFRDDQDRKDFVARLGNLANQTDTRILAWSLLSNHVHLLLFSGPAGLPLFMRRLLTGYAQGFNRRHKRRGHLFQNRYKSVVCEAVSRVRGKVGWILSREFGISLAEIARMVGVCTSAIAKAIQKMERQISQV